MITPAAALRKRAVVALSGGVDSSVAALLLHEQGFELLGVSMQVWDYRKNGGCGSRATCCAPQDFIDARRVAGKLGVPYYVFDFEATFRREVIDRFVADYLNGLTPNPCVDCNNRVKFRELRDRASALGCEFVATGHYARILDGPSGLRLLRGKDSVKDQSYFLYGLRRAELSSTLFPVGDLDKAQVREIARRAGLVTAEKPESQDICFVSDSPGEFVERIGRSTSGGPVLDSGGTIIGEHDGLHRFTVGQRRGLGIGGGSEPVYVLELDPARNAVIAGPKQELERESFVVGQLNWINEVGELCSEIECIAQLRHRHPGVRVRVRIEGERCLANFLDDWTTVSPGQAAVFYDLANEEVLGGGTIERGTKLQ